MSSIVQPYFWSEEAAHDKLGQIVWPDGPECPHCGNTDRIGLVTGKGARVGLKLCSRCRRQFRVTMATLFDSSHVPLQKWLQACFLLVCCDSRISAHQLHLKLEVTNKTALRMLQRLDPVATGVRRDFRRDSQRRAHRVDAWPEALGLTFGHAARSSAGAARFSVLPTKQFLGFVETARSLGWNDDEAAFAAILSASKRARKAIRKDAGFAGRAEIGRGELSSPMPAG